MLMCARVCIWCMYECTYMYCVCLGVCMHEGVCLCVCEH